jgi:hypothetical protein
MGSVTLEESARLLGPAGKKPREASWLLNEQDEKVARLHGRNVHGERPAVCRFCGQEIPAGQQRLKFAITNSKGWVVRQGALCVEQCHQSESVKQRLFDDACEAAVTASQYEECRAAGMFTPVDVDAAHPLTLYPRGK